VIFEESNRLRLHAKNIIPGGAHTYSKGDDQFPQLSPGFITRGKGSKVWDPDGNQFIDWGMGLRSVILGHAFEPVLDPVRKQLELGVNFTRPSIIESEVAELLVNLIPSAEMIKFAKNGSDVTTAAVKLSRAYTGRDIIVRCLDHPFFSVDDWFIGDTVCNSGVPSATQSLTKNFRYNDIESFRDVMETYKGQVACVIMEVAATSEPQPEFLECVRKLTKEQGTVLIFDEIITGFRWHISGAQHMYGVTPDLSTFGKSISNGFSLGALAGKREIMELGGIEHSKPRVFLLSTTNGGETHSLAAAKATIKYIKDNDVNTHLWSIGKILTDGFNSSAKEFGINNCVKMMGTACSPYQVFMYERGNINLPLRTLYLQEMIRHNVLIPYIAPSYSHTDIEVEQTLEASRKAMVVLKQAIESGTTEGLLIGEAVKPVFRKYN
jgi:glutamate-1-semialdehyde 2,1-aminomutase